jgi:F0F1-type ATP synthase epsilon subunit
MDRAQKRLDEKSEDIDYVRAKLAMLRALHRIQLAEGRRS